MDYLKVAELYNEIRQKAPNKIYQTNELYDILISIGFTKNGKLLTILNDGHIIHRIQRGYYRLSDKPLYYKKIENVMNEHYREYNKIYYHKTEKHINPFLKTAIEICESEGYLVIKK